MFCRCRRSFRRTTEPLKKNMYANYQKGPQGVQNDRVGGSRFTNLRQFQPFYSATEKLYSKYQYRIRNRTYPFVRVEPTHGEFIFPVNAN